MVDFIRTFRVLQISKLIKHFPGFQLLVSASTTNPHCDPLYSRRRWRRCGPRRRSSSSGSTASPCSWSSSAPLSTTQRGAQPSQLSPAQPSPAQLTVSVFRLTENPRNQFISIPNSMWWAVVTMCTVGTVNTEISFICLVQRSGIRSLFKTDISTYVLAQYHCSAKCSSYFKFISLQLLLRIWRYGAQNRPRHGGGSRVCHCR